MSLPAPVALLVRPAETFEEATTYPRLAVVLVVGVALLTAASVAVVAGSFAGVGGTVAVDNPERPADRVCDGDVPTPYAGEDLPGEVGAGTPDGCGEPRQVERSVGAHAASVVSGYWPTALFGTLATWPVLAWLVHLVVAPGESGYRRTLLDTSWAMVPLALPALARLVVVPRRADGLDAGSLDAAADAAVGITVGFTGPAVAVAALAATWSGYVCYGVARGGRGVSGDRAATAGVVVTAGLLAVAALPVVPTGGPLLLLGVPAVAAGVAVAAYARELLVRDARWDLIGMRGSRVGEPARWRVLVQQVVGVLAAAVALVVTGGVQVLL